MKVIFDYRCDYCGHEFEALVDREVSAQQNCPECTATAKRVIVFTPNLDPKMGLDTDFPTAARKWERGQYRRATGREWNRASKYANTAEDLERAAYERRKRFEK